MSTESQHSHSSARHHAADGSRCAYSMWGEIGEDFDKPAFDQLHAACGLPVAAAGALMPDAHVGYGLPIGGVLATRNAVVPYAVGVDIACRMKMTVLDLPASTLATEHGRKRLTDAIETETCFGVGGAFKKRKLHPVLDMDWNVSPVTARNKDKAWGQLGTSGSGNHFVEFGVLTVREDAPHGASAVNQSSEGGSHARFDLAPGTYLALLSHSGSRGTGAAVCDHYSKLAMSMRPDLPKDQRFLAWLDMDTEEGRAYWGAMNLMGEYAAANHACIHDAIAKNLGAEVIADVENHHNFAWKETHTINGKSEEVYVHRKGATPAGAGVMGVIPGSMAQPGFVVMGLGSDASLHSASHGAGRVMSRTKARESIAWGNVKKKLRELEITVLSAGVDEAPDVYKDIHTVMARQRDLVRVVAQFDPKLVKMAPEGEKAED
ncbi:MAG: RtcB family protein [Phycisphaeraceae bacterium]|nr:MAG: RtcB family protein [Phycisphaeraceae bacterium]